MFHVLHRLYVFCWAVLGIGGVVWLYPRTGISEPMWDWYAVWQNKPEASVKPAAELSGTVVRVMDGASFTLRTPDRQMYSVGLLGINPPALKPRSTPAEKASAERSRDVLNELVLSNEVQVVATWLDPQHRAVGVVHMGETDVNAAMVESGLVKLKHDFIRGLSWREQYALLRAERKARQSRNVETK